MNEQIKEELVREIMAVIQRFHAKYKLHLKDNDFERLVLDATGEVQRKHSVRIKKLSGSRLMNV